MNSSTGRFSNCLWMDGQAEQAAHYYLSIFNDARIVNKTYYTSAGQDQHGMKPGTVLTVSCILDGQEFVLLNGGPQFKFSEAISFMIKCKDQQEIDYYWDALTREGSEAPCGWCKDKYGVSWQVCPADWDEMVASKDEEAVSRMMLAMFKMKKLDIATLRNAFRGKE